MFAKRPNSEPDSKEQPNNPSHLTRCDLVAESRPHVVPEEIAQLRNDLIPDRGKVLKFPPQPSKTQPTWPDYEELFPATEAEATEPLRELTDAVINRRCYYSQYWPQNTVFRIKDIDAENNTVYLNLIYRWVSSTQVRLIKNLMPQRPPRSLELDYLIDTDDALDF
ncbi:MAG TPA: hypothetical protein V6D14_35700 [Coleofasciculaceae cyanobacterium]|jgi:hypothetical protein